MLSRTPGATTRPEALLTVAGIQVWSVAPATKAAHSAAEKNSGTVQSRGCSKSKWPRYIPMAQG